MQNMRYLFFIIALISITACGVQSYGTKIIERKIHSSKIAPDKNGLSQKQIEVITATKPPESFPVDIAIVILKNGNVDPQVEDVFTHGVIQNFSKSKIIKRVTLIPDFLVPESVNFNAIQELGIRSLSEYVIIFNLNGPELFHWTNMIENKSEIKSSVNFIIVDSFTSAILTSDKLFSTQVYYENIVKVGEQRNAQKILFAEQAKILSKKIDILFSKTE